MCHPLGSIHVTCGTSLPLLKSLTSDGAADRLHLAQPALTRHIKALEEVMQDKRKRSGNSPFLVSL